MYWRALASLRSPRFTPARGEDNHCPAAAYLAHSVHPRARGGQRTIMAPYLRWLGSPAHVRKTERTAMGRHVHCRFTRARAEDRASEVWTRAA